MRNTSRRESGKCLTLKGVSETAPSVRERVRRGESFVKDFGGSFCRVEFRSCAGRLEKHNVCSGLNMRPVTKPRGHVDCTLNEC